MEFGFRSSNQECRGCLSGDCASCVKKSVEDGVENNSATAQKEANEFETVKTDNNLSEAVTDCCDNEACPTENVQANSLQNDAQGSEK